MDRPCVPILIAVLALVIVAPARAEILWLEPLRITSQSGLTTADTSPWNGELNLTALARSRSDPTAGPTFSSSITVERQFQVIDAPLGESIRFVGFFDADIESYPGSRGTASARLTLTGPGGILFDMATPAQAFGGNTIYSDLLAFRDPSALLLLAEGLYTWTARLSASFSLSPFSPPKDAETSARFRLWTNRVSPPPPSTPEPSSVVSTLAGLGLMAGWALRRRTGRRSASDRSA